MEKKDGKTIVALTTENVKRVVAVHIEPGDSPTVVIGGKNAAGKSSVLDSIMFAFGGAASIQEKPIRDGEEFARVEVDLGDIVVERVFTEGSSQVVVKTKDGAKYSSPQKLLDGMFARLAFDPLGFSGMKPSEQSVALMELVGLSLDDLKSELAKISEARREKNADLRAAKNRAAGTRSEIEAMIGAAESIPEEAPDVSEAERNLAALQLQIMEKRGAGTTLQLVDRDLSRLQAELAELESIDDDANARREKMNEEEERQVRQMNERHEREKNDLAVRQIRELSSLKEQFAAARPLLEEDIEKAKKSASERKAGIETAIEEKKTEAERLRALSESEVDIESAEKILAERKRLSRVFELNKRFEEETAAAEVIERESAELTKQIEAIAARQKERIAKTEFPIEGLSVCAETGGVLFNGIPFEQASQAQRIRTSVAIGIAANPKLKVLLIREGSLLDDDGMKLVAEMAAAAGAQIWIERVGDRDEGAIIIEDGAVRGVPLPEVKPPKKKRSKKDEASAE